MSDQQQQKKETFTTPLAVAKWVTLGKPDTQFNADGEYLVTLCMPKDASETVALMEKLDDAHTQAVEAVREQLLSDPKTKLKAKTIKTSYMPYKTETDREGNETGNILISFKTKASGTRKDKTTWVFKPAMFDAKGAPLPKDTAVWGGTKMRVAYQFNAYYVAASQEAGLSLKLQAVKIIDLKTGRGYDAKAFGFGEEEEGYTSEPSSPVGAEVPADGGDF